MNATEAAEYLGFPGLKISRKIPGLLLDYGYIQGTKSDDNKYNLTLDSLTALRVKGREYLIEAIEDCKRKCAGKGPVDIPSDGSADKSNSVFDRIATALERIADSLEELATSPKEETIIKEA